MTSHFEGFFYPPMPTIYQRLQAYRAHPEAIHLGNKKLKRLYNLIKYLYDRNPGNPPVEFVESIEGVKTFTVRLYPDTYQKTIDGLIWKFHLSKVANLAAQVVVVKPEPPPKKEKRKREKITEKPLETTKRKRTPIPAWTGNKK